MSPSAAPGSLPVSERLPTLDILRGFALMGILIMNMPGFSSSFFAEADGSHLWNGPVDRLAEQVREALFAGKFNSMFSLLFGIGFTIQYTRMQQLDPDTRDRAVPAAACGAVPVRRRPRLRVLARRRAAHLCVAGLRARARTAPGQRPRPRRADRRLSALSGAERLAAPGGVHEGTDRPACASGSVVRSQQQPGLWTGQLRRHGAREPARDRALLRRLDQPVGHTRLVRDARHDDADRRAGRPPPLGAACGRTAAADPPPDLVGTGHRPGLRRRLHRDLRAESRTGPVAHQDRRQRLLQLVAPGIDDLLRARHRAHRAERTRPALARALGRGRAHAADQLPDADRRSACCCSSTGVSACG